MVVSYDRGGNAGSPRAQVSAAGRPYMTGKRLPAPGLREATVGLFPLWDPAGLEMKKVLLEQNRFREPNEGSGGLDHGMPRAVT